MNHTYFFIESDRLRIIPLSFNHHILNREPNTLAKEMGLASAGIEMEPEFQVAYTDAVENFWKPNILKDPDNYKWFTNWLIVLKFTNTAIGGIGLAGMPNEKGEVEIGYSISIPYRTKGYATEALLCLAHWAFDQSGVHAITAHTHREKNASQKVLENAGFEYIAPEITEDGEVFLWKKTK